MDKSDSLIDDKVPKNGEDLDRHLEELIKQYKDAVGNTVRMLMDDGKPRPAADRAELLNELRLLIGSIMKAYEDEKEDRGLTVSNMINLLLFTNYLSEVYSGLIEEHDKLLAAEA